MALVIVNRLFTTRRAPHFLYTRLNVVAFFIAFAPRMVFISVMHGVITGSLQGCCLWRAMLGTPVLSQW